MADCRSYSSDHRPEQYALLRGLGVAPIEALAGVYGPRLLPASEGLAQGRWVRLKIISTDPPDGVAWLLEAFGAPLFREVFDA